MEADWKTQRPSFQQQVSFSTKVTAHEINGDRIFVSQTLVIK